MESESSKVLRQYGNKISTFNISDTVSSLFYLDNPMVKTQLVNSILEKIAGLFYSPRNEFHIGHSFIPGYIVAENYVMSLQQEGYKVDRFLNYIKHNFYKTQ